MDKCLGCETGGRESHSQACAVEHFLSYSGFHDLPADVAAKIRMAYEHGFDAGKAHSSPPRTEKGGAK